MKRVLLSPILFLLFLCTCLAQDYTTINKVYLKSWLTDSRDLAIAPFHWDNKNSEKAIAAIGATALMLPFDQPIKSFFQRNRTSVTDDIVKYGLEPLGSGKYSIPLFGLLYLEGVIFKHPRNRMVALNGAKAFVFSGLLVEVPKILFERHRPFQSPDNPFVFDGPKGHTKFSSFPSGHTAIAFTLATVVAEEYKDKKLIPILAYTLASAVAVSRINDNKHWASDVVMGASIGYAVGKLVSRKHRGK